MAHEYPRQLFRDQPEPKAKQLNEVAETLSFTAAGVKRCCATHVRISRKHFDKYLWEFTFRSNHRARENARFDLLVACL
jgi:hypothetical protein